MSRTRSAQAKKKTIPPAGPKVGVRQALKRTNQKFHKALAKLAK